MKKIISLVLLLALTLSALTVTVSAATLKNGSSGTEVRYLEMNLQALGFFDGTPNKKFDTSTKAAVLEYQRSRSLSQDGIAGKNTLGELYDEITEVQRMLNRLGYSVGECDGIAGSKFFKGLAAFQRDYRLVVTGYVDADTLWTLRSVYGDMMESITYPASVEEAEDMLILAKKEKGVTAGSIRYIAQVTSDKYYVKNYFKYTLNRKTAYLNSSDKCTRCALSMCLSYIGIDADPGYMSELMGSVDIPSPVRDVPGKIPGIQRVNSDDFETLFNNYASDEDFTPVLVYYDYKSSHHAIVVFGFDGEYYLAADSAANATHIIRVKFNDNFSKIIESPDYGKYTSKNKVTAVCQWKLG